RRSALGIIRIVLENNLRVKLRSIASDELLEFMLDRLKVQLKDEGIRHDVISAVTASGDDDILRIVAKAKALQDFLATEDGLNLLAGYRRAANILAIEEKKDGKPYAARELNTSALKEKEELALAQLLPDTQSKLNALVRDEKFEEAMKQLASLRAPIDTFFDKIMVNCEDKDLRTNRLRLLSAIRESVDSIANFALLEGETKETKKKAA
ncbi:MAG: glycine--tRNA ligase subunit beta, partial [Proteobacteria bacterium]|nr:glycine--tRNA ligase subunit beta [Pseudomonadota bacterium]